MSTVEVTTSAGLLRGERAADGSVAVFRGIPYAAAPTGDNRFRPPQPHQPWSGVREATTFGAAAIQGVRRAAQPRGSFGTMFGADSETSEDCLFLNVWTPGPDTSRRPVMVWIHGGAFRMGTGASPSYEATRLAARGDVVVVTINYRLGLLGFLSHPELGANFGLLDQVAALEWVQREISAFGGDPNDVTIFGESAGGKSVECLLAMPAARGLYRRAILQSTYDPPMDAGAAAASAERLAATLGVGAAVDRLRHVPLDDLLAAEAEAMGRSGAAGFGSGPVIDGQVLPRRPREALADGTAAGIPIVVGTTLDESALFSAMTLAQAGEMADADVARQLATTVAGPSAPAELGGRALEVYRKVREAMGEDTSGPALLVAASTDRMFRQHSIRVAEAQAAHAPTFMYLFTWTSPTGRLGACHGIELPFVFGTFSSPLARLSGDGPAAEALSAAVQEAWLSFARAGRPASPNLPEWPAYDTDRRATMVLGATCHLEDAPLDDIRRLWVDAGA